MRAYTLAAGLALTLSSALSAQGASANVPPGAITVRANGKQRVFSRAELAKIERHDHRILSEGTGDSATVSGVNLWDVLQLAGVPSVEASGRQRVVMCVRLAGADGQNAVVSLVEIDPGFSRRIAVVADIRNGKQLDASEGPWRVFIPDDMRHARWIRGLVTIEVLTVKP